MSKPLQSPSDRATIALPDLAQSLRLAMRQYGHDPELKRALGHALSGVTRRLGEQEPNRRDRRGGKG